MDDVIDTYDTYVLGGDNPDLGDWGCVVDEIDRHEAHGWAATADSSYPDGDNYRDPMVHLLAPLSHKSIDATSATSDSSLTSDADESWIKVIIPGIWSICQKIVTNLFTEQNQA